MLKTGAVLVLCFTLLAAVHEVIAGCRPGHPCANGGTCEVSTSRLHDSSSVHKAVDEDNLSAPIVYSQSKVV